MDVIPGLGSFSDAPFRPFEGYAHDNSSAEAYITHALLTWTKLSSRLMAYCVSVLGLQYFPGEGCYLFIQIVVYVTITK